MVFVCVCVCVLWRHLHTATASKKHTLWKSLLQGGLKSSERRENEILGNESVALKSCSGLKF